MGQPCQINICYPGELGLMDPGQLKGVLDGGLREWGAAKGYQDSLDHCRAPHTLAAKDSVPLRTQEDQRHDHKDGDQNWNAVAE